MLLFFKTVYTLSNFLIYFFKIFIFMMHHFTGGGYSMVQTLCVNAFLFKNLIKTHFQQLISISRKLKQLQEVGEPGYHIDLFENGPQ